MSHDTLPAAPPAQTHSPTSTRRHGVGFWVVAAAFLTAMAFSTVPSPLYPLYQVRDGFSTFMVTIVFAAYAVGVIVSLVLAGHVSDWVGRKKVLIAALLLELVAAVMFLCVTALPLLLVARLITGLGVGALTATATAYLHELHSTHRPTASGQRFEKVSTAANIGGLGVGPLVAGFLAQFVAAPLHTPYLVFAVLIVVAVVGVALVPETVAGMLERPAYRPQRISADHGDRAGYFAAAAAGFASFAVFGVFTSVAPGFVAGTLDHPSRALSGATVFAVFGTAALAQTMTSRMSSTAKLSLGISAEALGLIALVIGMHTLSLPTFLVGGVVAGIGAGVLFKAAVGAVAAMAAPAERSEALAGLFLIAYLGLGIPALGIGIATLSMSATAAMTGLAAIVLILLRGVATLARRASATPR
ncbi:MFS transporter [Rhodococcus fascians]|uniref:MFS transporter n=1 Tax=Rhodococcoides fascians TaxID=1828 RepID=UPI001961389D|nr:MFS transporter [Rhodococcus fascians]MBM7246214.1 MFS transporter [Rhodococcus fascians]MBY3812025.1 MFS transporter [Rhodococcus fascians]MBY3843516.1 MFS transporter [Rhodococcus fascians]MBY3846194.1 MFS transporter [Rhodococcus fascians]MBY3853360.1 MFS transporter [Rhodococcus fascians]